VVEFVVAEKGSVRNIHNHLRNVCESAAVDRSTAGRWAKSMTASETGKSELHDLPHSGRPVTAASPEVLQCTDAIAHEDRRTTKRQLALSQVSAKEVSVTLFELLDIRKCAQDGFLRDSQPNMKVTEKPFLPSSRTISRVKQLNCE
jgi:hypothetical protein